MPVVTPRLRKFTGRLLLMLAPLVVLLLVVEVVLRVAGPAVGPDPESDPRFIAAIPSAELGWIFPADTTGTFRSSGRNTPLATNAWGLRSPSLSDTTETIRLLLLGDSYAFGWGVEADSSFGSLLGAELEVQVVNAAIPGFSIYQQVRMLEYVTARADVDAVVATISLANDAIDEERIMRFAPDHLEEFDYGLRDSRSLTAKMIRASRILTLIDERTMHIQFGLRNARGKGHELANHSLMMLSDRCRELNLPLVWVIIPRSGEVRGGGIMTGFLNRETEKLRDLFLWITDNYGSPGIDLLPALTEAQKRGECYLPADAHWNERGHRAVADTLVPLLKQAINPPK